MDLFHDMKTVSFTEEHSLIRRTAKQFADERVAPTAAERDRDHRFPEELIPELGALGLLGMKVSVDDGGSGADTTSYALALEALAEADASTSVTVAVCNLAADILSAFGNAEQKARVLTPYLEGKLGAGAFCLSEPEAGSDAKAMTTTARQEGDAFVIDGAKQWITNGTYAGFFIVFAITDKNAGSRGITCFLVEKGAEGLTVGAPERKMGLRSSNTVPLTFEGCRVPASNIIGEVGQGYAIALSGLDGGRIGIAAQAVGIAAAAIREGVQYASDRKAFGKTVADFQASQFAIADSQLELEASWLLTLRAAHQRDKTGRSARESSMAKLMATESCGRIVDRMLQLHGGYGYVEDFAIERLYRDARVTRIYEGTSEVQRIVIARELLK